MHGRLDQTVPVSQFLVKAAARLLLLLRLRAADSDFCVADDCRPRLWPAGGGWHGGPAAVSLEQRWQALYTNKCVLLHARATRAGSRS